MALATKDRILDSAEELFSRRGVAETSLRMITDHASANIASINYYFQSKDELIKAVYRRRIEPINAKRLAMLDKALQSNPGGTPSLELVLEAFLRPAVEMAFELRAIGRPIGPLFGRLYTEPNEVVSKHIQALMAPLADRFHQAFQAALPGYSARTIYWRMHFAIGTLAHTLAAMPLIEALSHGQVEAPGAAAVWRHMVAFLTPAFRAKGGDKHEAAHR